MGDRIAVMKDGVLQQADAPRKVYDEPANLFVAKFIGSPPMNTWAGELRGRPCTVGVRPEYLAPVSESDPDALRARVSGVENTGRECIVYLEAEGLPTLVMTSGADLAVRPGQTLPIRMNREKFLFFDAETGARLIS